MCHFSEILSNVWAEQFSDITITVCVVNILCVPPNSRDILTGPRVRYCECRQGRWEAEMTIIQLIHV